MMPRSIGPTKNHARPIDATAEIAPRSTFVRRFSVRSMMLASVRISPNWSTISMITKTAPDPG